MGKPNSFIFLGDDLFTSLPLPLNLFHEYQLTKPTDEQIEEIRNRLNQLSISLQGGSFVNKFEIDWFPDPDNPNAWKSQILEPHNWKYLIIEYTPWNKDSQIFEQVVGLATCDLTVLFNGVYINADNPKGYILGYLSHSLISFNYLIENQIRWEKKEISTNTLKEFKDLYQLLHSFETQKSKYFELDKALQDFVSIKSISRLTPFKVLAYFSVLEALLTTNQNRTTGISLTHQLKKKIILLNNRFLSPINFRSYFAVPDTVSDEKIIEKLYDYRSSIAHGKTVDFQNDLQILSSV